MERQTGVRNFTSHPVFKKPRDFVEQPSVQFFKAEHAIFTKWMFPKIGGVPPKSSILIGFSHSEPSILGYPYGNVDLGVWVMTPTGVPTFHLAEPALPKGVGMASTGGAVGALEVPIFFTDLYGRDGREPY